MGLSVEGRSQGVGQWADKGWGGGERGGGEAVAMIAPTTGQE